MWVFSPYGIYFFAAWAWSTHRLLLCLLTSPIRNRTIYVRLILCL